MHYGKTKLNQSHFMLDMLMVLYKLQQCRLTHSENAATTSKDHLYILFYQKLKPGKPVLPAFLSCSYP